MNAIDLASLLCSRLCHDLLSPVGALNNGIELGWLVAGDRLPKGAVKLLLNLAMIAGDALVRGGRLDVGVERSADKIEMVIRAEGPRVLVDPSLRATIVRGAQGQAVEPRAAGAWLAHELAAEAGGSIQISDASAEVLLIGVTLPVKFVEHG